MFGDVENAVGVTVPNGRHTYWIRCVVEDIMKFHITRDGWTTTAVEKEAEWFASISEGAKNNHEGVETK